MEMQMDFIRKLPTPIEIKEEYPLADGVKEMKEERDREIAKIFSGEEDKFVLIIGPCSADNEDSVCEYSSSLDAIQVNRGPSGSDIKVCFISLTLINRKICSTV